MKLLFCCLVIGILPAPGQRDLSIAPINVYVEFERDPPPAVLKALREEVGSIMSPMGLHFAWRSMDDSRQTGISVELAVVSFKGRCDSSGLLAHDTHPRVLGWTDISDGTILPFSGVDCDGIRGFVQRELLHAPLERREAIFGRAIGRVLAHELYHVFANTVRHGACGVAKAAYTRHDLLSPDFRFEQHESDELRRSGRHIADERGTGS